MALQEQERTYRILTIKLLLLLFIFHSIIAATLDIGNDEAYYWMYSLRLKTNYFDHPPMVAIWIRLFSLQSLFGDGSYMLRLGSLVGNLLSAWFLFRAATIFYGPRAGWFTAILYNASFYAGVTAGIHIMPDAPQMVFWTLSLWMLARIMKAETDWLSWIVFGISTGLCIMSKVHGAFLWAGLGAFILFHKRNWLRLPQLYTAAACSLILVAPLIYWNIRHEFITYRFHTQRVAISHFVVEGSSLLREAVGQVFFNNPVNVLLIAMALVAHIRSRNKKGYATLLCWIGLPHAGFLLFISLFRDTTLPHWSGPAYITLLPLAAAWLSGMVKNTASLYLKTALGLYLITLASWWGFIHYYPGTIGSKQTDQYGKGDISLDFFGWPQAGEAFRKLYASDLAAGKMPAGSPVVFGYWWGAHIQYYFCRQAGIPAFALGEMHQVREYYWRNRELKMPAAISDAYCIMPTDENYELPDRYFHSKTLAAVITVNRSGKPAHIFKVYRLQGWRSGSRF